MEVLIQSDFSADISNYLKLFNKQLSKLQVLQLYSTKVKSAVTPEMLNFCSESFFLRVKVMSQINTKYE